MQQPLCGVGFNKWLRKKHGLFGSIKWLAEFILCIKMDVFSAPDFWKPRGYLIFLHYQSLLSLKIWESSVVLNCETLDVFCRLVSSEEPHEKIRQEKRDNIYKIFMILLIKLSKEFWRSNFHEFSFTVHNFFVFSLFEFNREFLR